MNSPCVILTTTNLMQPLGNWTPIATNQFDPTGFFTYTNHPGTAPGPHYFILQSP